MKIDILNFRTIEFAHKLLDTYGISFCQSNVKVAKVLGVCHVYVIKYYRVLEALGIIQRHKNGASRYGQTITISKAALRDFEKKIRGRV